MLAKAVELAEKHGWFLVRQFENEANADTHSRTTAVEILDDFAQDGLEWCEFCWSVRKLFAKCDIPYRSVDLDSVEYQQDDWGGQIRAALKARTDISTIPQIFVGGELIGGCTEAFDAFRDGSLQSKLASRDVKYDTGVELDPYDLLPTWLHPR
jgi:cysteine synthase A